MVASQKQGLNGEKDEHETLETLIAANLTVLNNKCSFYSSEID